MAQLRLLQSLGFAPDRVSAGIATFERALSRLKKPADTQPDKVFLFSGHMIDAPDRKQPRFPADKEPIAAAAIAKALDDLGATAADLALTQGYTRDTPSQNHETLKALLCQNLPGPLLIAPIKGCESGPKATRLMLKHLPGIRFWLPAAHATQLTPPATTLVGLAIRELQSGSQSANVNVRHMAVLWTDRCYTPCPNAAIARVAEQLRKAKQAFLTPLRFDANDNHLLADFALLRDHGAEPAFVVGSAYPDSRAKKALATVLRRYFPVSIFDVDATALST